jgi:lipoprotein-releasing system ATP-binding protein
MPLMNTETHPPDEPLIELRDVVKTYSTGDLEGAGGTVLAGINLRIQAGDSIAITGPSGSGKSTLLNLMGGLDEPSLGTVTIRGHLLNHLTENQRALVRAREIGFVFQAHHLLPQCTALENILLPAAINHETAPATLTGRAHDLLARTGLTSLAHRFPAELSGGERQRVAVLRALINSPAILLADEPTGALDADTAQALVDLLRDLQQSENLALVLVTHSPAVARSMTRQWELNHGRLEIRS